MPIDRSRYPVDWEEIALAVKEAAGWRCERCGVGHMEDGTMGSCLTVHHLDQDPENPEARLEALCARCHLADERRLRRQSKTSGQGVLFEEEGRGAGG